MSHEYQNVSSLDTAQGDSSSKHHHQRTTSASLLFNQANLAWSQPSEYMILAPAPVVTTQETVMSHTESSSTSTNVNYPSSELANIASQMMETLSVEKKKPEDGETLPAQTFVPPAVPTQPPPPPMPSQSTSNQATPEEPQQPEFYKEVDSHWFYQKDPTNPDLSWQPFSLVDSQNLESAYRSGTWDQTIPTNGTRFDVTLRDRSRKPVYWDAPATKVQRCSWFFKRDSDYRFIPYSEEVALLLENSYRECFESKTWNRRVDISPTDFVYFYSYNSVYHYVTDPPPSEGWGGLMTSDTTAQPRYAYRGVWLTNQQPERDESIPVDNLVFMIHGIGDFCDLSFRKLIDVVDDFREITQEMLGSHYSCAGRVEVLPIKWHRALHTQQLDQHLAKITLPSIPRLRGFTNDTILDALFYTSPMHSQTILHAVASELNRIYALFLSRNPHQFEGKIALVGHSLGSLILFDLLSNQFGDSKPEETTSEYTNYYGPMQINFQPAAMFGLGSPTPMFLSVRGIQSLPADFRFPTCPAFYNVFHPYDPIAYRMEPLVRSEFSKLKPVLIPHHKGRKRIHLELRDSIARVGTDLKQKVMSSIKGALNSIYGFAKAHRLDADDELPDVPQETQQEPEVMTSQMPQSPTLGSLLSLGDSAEDAETKAILAMDFGRLNGGRRIDYVLQESPIEYVNEYVFAMAAHGCYWLSHDTSLLILRELYPDSYCKQPETAQSPPSTS